MFSDAAGPADGGGEERGPATVEEVRWQVKWSAEGVEEGPIDTATLLQWQQQGKLSKGAYVRKTTQQSWYSAERIDFELYL